VNKPLRSHSDLPLSQFTGLLLWVVLALPPIRLVMENVMVWHMGVQIPALVVTGALSGPIIAPFYQQYFAPWNGRGVAGIALTIITLLFWMLPRSLDATLDDSAMEVAKFTTLPLLAGLPLAHSWPQLSLIGRGIVWSNLFAMLFVLAWLYLAAPVRVCNNYLVNDQEVLGWYLFGASIAAALYVGWRALFGANICTVDEPRGNSLPVHPHCK
jgi:hypothetical protein